jgi:hypothetical protein
MRARKREGKLKSEPSFEVTSSDGWAAMCPAIDYQRASTSDVDARTRVTAIRKFVEGYGTLFAKSAKADSKLHQLLRFLPQQPSQ